MDGKRGEIHRPLKREEKKRTTSREEEVVQGFAPVALLSPNATWPVSMGGGGYIYIYIHTYIVEGKKERTDCVWGVGFSAGESRLIAPTPLPPCLLLRLVAAAQGPAIIESSSSGGGCRVPQRSL